jgi:FAD:protein FMN transferase
LVLRLATRAMGTRFELVLAGDDDDPRLRAVGEQALGEIEEVDARLSLFRRDSLLAHINRQAHAGVVRLDPETSELFATINEVVNASRGAFDPTVAPLMRALGLHGEDSGAPVLDEEQARARLGWARTVCFTPQTRELRFREGNVALDLGGIAKGHGLDLAARVLRENGVDNALLHGGTSSILALGTPPGLPGWRIDIGTKPPAPIAVLKDACLSVSACASSHAHVLDPRSGRPANGAHLVATVATSATLADAWSTALLVDPGLTPPDEVEALVFISDAWRHMAHGPDHAFTSIPLSPLPATHP